MTDILAALFWVGLGTAASYWVYMDNRRRGKSRWVARAWGAAVFWSLFFFLPLYVLVRFLPVFATLGQEA